MREPFEAVFVAVKSYDTEWATQLAVDYLRQPDGVVVDFQNGINDDRVAAVAGRERTLGCVITDQRGHVRGRPTPCAPTAAAPASRSASTTAATRRGRGGWPRS